MPFLTSSRTTIGHICSILRNRSKTLSGPAQYIQSKANYATDNKKKKQLAAEEDPMPSYVQTRLDIWKRLKTRQDEVLAKKPRDIMTVTFPDGRTEEGFTWDTTPFEVVKELSNTFAAEVIAAKVNGQLWDLERPFETDSTVQFLKFREPEAKAVYWNSTAFILGDALERAFGEQHNALLATAAVNENGLYCDMQTDKKTITTKEIETKMIRSLFVKHQFERLEIGKSDLLELFAYNKFKIDHINENVPDDGTATVYRCGTYIDICELPHVRYNKKIKAYKLRKICPVTWKNQTSGDKLHRIYAISSLTETQLKESLQKPGHYK